MLKLVSRVLLEIEEYYKSALEFTLNLNSSLEMESIEDIKNLLAARAEILQQVENLRKMLNEIQKQLLTDKNVDGNFNLSTLKYLLPPSEFQTASAALMRINNILAEIIEVDRATQAKGEVIFEKIKSELSRILLARSTHNAYTRRAIVSEPRFFDRNK